MLLSPELEYELFRAEQAELERKLTYLRAAHARGTVPRARAWSRAWARAWSRAQAPRGRRTASAVRLAPAVPECCAA
jgi:hypothetical protein